MELRVPQDDFTNYQPDGSPNPFPLEGAPDAGGHTITLSVAAIAGQPSGRSAAIDQKAAGADCLEEFCAATGAEFTAQLSATTIADFVEFKFVPEHVAKKGSSGRRHYQAMLKHVLTPDAVDRVFHAGFESSRARLKAVPNWPYLGSLRLRDARPDHVRRLISAAQASGYSTQTVKHIRNVVMAIFEHAKKKRWLAGDNPASLVSLPGMIRKEKHVLTLAQANEVLRAMRYPEKEMALIAILTGMNMAEICGLQWKHVNLEDAWSSAGGEPTPPKTIAVRRQSSCGELENVARKSRIRNLQIPEPLFPVLSKLKCREDFTGPDDFVLVSRAGTPVRESCIAARRLKPLGEVLRMPWLSWQVFRRTQTTLAYQLGMQFLGDRVGTCCGVGAEPKPAAGPGFIT